MKIAYTFVAVDIFHYGHLRLLEHAKQSADRHICGLLSDEVCRKWNGNLVMIYEEREAVLRALTCVDEVVEQTGMDPTEALKSIHRRFPDAELILFKGHQAWSAMPGTHFIESIGGRVITPPFYKRLSRSLIRDELNRTSSVTPCVDESYSLGHIDQFGGTGATKAETLHTLQPLLTKAKIEDMFAFTKSQWEEQPEKIVDQIRERFHSKLVVRSSARVEDSAETSYAGFFHSELDVDSRNVRRIRDAIDKVIASYQKHENHSGADQVLVQSQTEGVRISGVVLTRNLVNNAPYYTINYDVSSSTDSVTSGLESQRLEILRNIDTAELPQPWCNLIEAVREVEKLLDNLTLDVEFAIDECGEVTIFQARPLAAVSRFGHVDDENVFRTVAALQADYDRCAREALVPETFILSDMCFWNPAEIIGDRANNLAYSLYRYLILHRAWNRGLVPLGYPDLQRDLMVRIGMKPYIDVTASFTALLPADLDGALRDKLLAQYLSKLEKRPELHDKIEFEIVHNCFTPVTDDQLAELEPALTRQEIGQLRDSLIRLTQGLFGRFEDIEREDRRSLEKLADRREQMRLDYAKLPCQEKIQMILDLLNDAGTLGTPQFARMARLAFVGSQYLKGLVAKGVVSSAEIEAYVASIETVSSQLNHDFEEVIAGRLDRKKFIDEYGHLRPGTYDITNLPYSKQESYFSISAPVDVCENCRSALTFDRPALISRLESYLQAFPIRVSAEQLLNFIARTTQCRELFKFEFTKNLSLALEWLVEVGDDFGLSRRDLSHLSIECLQGISNGSSHADIKALWLAVAAGRQVREQMMQFVTSPALIFERGDLEYIQSFSPRPNFISSTVETAEVVRLDGLEESDYDRLTDKIVLLEKADPGYDWIFTKGIKGLITKYGGVASHMAIRCAEFGLPAAIGCGDVLFDKLSSCRLVELDCMRNSLKPLR